MKTRLLSVFAISLLTASLLSPITLISVVKAQGDVIINQPMSGDLVITANQDVNALNNSGNDQQSKDLLVKFELTDDINVDKKYIKSVVYNLGVRISSGNCSAKNYDQDWLFYMTEGDFEEFRAVFADIQSELDDDTKLMLTQNHKPTANVSTFDITDGYKTHLDENKQTFGIRTKVTDYAAVFFPGSQIPYNYLTYTIDGAEILSDINTATTGQELDNLVKKNGAAIGIKSYKTLPASVRAELAQELLELGEKTVLSINQAIDSKLQSLVVHGGDIRKSATYEYSESTAAQGASATLTARTGAYWAPRYTRMKALFVFDITNVATEFLGSMSFTILRNGGGGTDTITTPIWLADSTPPNATIGNDPFYLDFKLADSKITLVAKGDKGSIDITEHAKTQSNTMFIGVAGITDECLDNNDNYPRLDYTYDIGKILDAFETSTISESKEILGKVGSALGMDAQQLTGSNLTKAAMNLSGKEIANLQEFLELVAEGIANVDVNQIITALNQAGSLEGFKSLLNDFGEVLGLELDALSGLPSQTMDSIYTNLYNGGQQYNSSAQFVQRYQEIVDAVYADILAELTGTEIEQTKTFLTNNGLLLGIPQDLLDNKLEILALAFTTGAPIASINQFREIYQNYQEAAISSILMILNNSVDINEFEANLTKYKDELGINLKLYDKIPQRESLYLSLIGIAQTKDEFIAAFNENVGKFFAESQALYATDECFVSPSKSVPDNGSVQGWAGAKGGNTHFIKHDLTGQAIDVDKLAVAVLKVPLANRTETLPQNITYRLYTAGTGWKGASDYYSTMQSKGIMDGQTLIAETLMQTQKWGDLIEFDITDYIKGLAQNGGLGEISFEYCVEGGSVIFARRGNSETFAPLSLVYMNGVGKTIDYAYDGENTKVSVSTDIIINFNAPLVDSSFDKKNITVSKSGVIMSGYSVEKVSNQTAKIVFPAPLEYDTSYKVELSSDIRYAQDSNTYIFNSLSFKTEKPPLEFTGLKVYSGGEQIGNLSERTEDSVRVTASVNNNSVSAGQKVTIALTLIRNNGDTLEMKGFSLVAKTLNIGDSNSVETWFDIPLGADGYFIAVEVWDSLVGMKTLFKTRLY